MTCEVWINVYWDHEEGEQFLGVFHESRRLAKHAAEGYDCKLLYRIRVRPRLPGA